MNQVRAVLCAANWFVLFAGRFGDLSPLLGSHHADRGTGFLRMRIREDGVSRYAEG
jgi:hypothetical protein